MRRSSVNPRTSVDISPPPYLGRVRQATLDDSGVPTCLSALPHTPNADRDSLFQHYLGCLEFRDRAKFLHEENPFWKQKVGQEVKNETLKLRATNQKVDEEKLQEEAQERMKKTIQALAISIEAQYKRTVVLRQALSKETFSDSSEVITSAPDRDAPEPRSFVGYIEQSGRKWRKSPEYLNGIKHVRKWRKEQDSRDIDTTDANPANGPHMVKEAGRDEIQRIVGALRDPESMKEKITGYNLERDVNAYLIQYTRKPKPAEATADPKPKSDPPFDPKMRHEPATPHEESLEDIRFKGKFPDQRLSMDLLLRSAHDETLQYDRDILQQGSGPSGAHRNILSKDSCDKKDPTRMRYLHIPANNMEWVESAIAGYYGDTHPALHNGHRELPATNKTQMLLRAQFWRGQLHGARSGVVHARYMRPLCERISSSVHEIEDNPNNIVIFMPYMHWETDRMRNTVAKMVDDQSCKQLLKQENNDRNAKNDRIAKRSGIKYTSNKIVHTGADPNDHLNIVLNTNSPRQRIDRSLTGLVPRVAKLTQGGIKVEEDGHLQVSSGRPLGQYLIDAARLYEAMSTFRDKQMIDKYLYHNPPLHPRRTLDQSHYWTLKTTKARDRDQVVYRGTNIDLGLTHKFCEVPKRVEQTIDWKKSLKSFSIVLQEHDPQDMSAKQDQGQQEATKHPKRTNSSWLKWPLWGEAKCKHWQWVGHWKRTDEQGCEHCTSEIKKISKLIMVDQLWMWVLDEQTIITSFPRRYGYNKYDLHGIHKSIRNRLASARKNQIRSIFDVALVVLDECSNTFFDRTKTHDSQPQVMDIFSEAIGDVTNKHTISFQHVWHWTQKASNVYRSKPRHDEASDLHVPLLDIHPEGKLQREIKDILDELDIMISITRRQRELIRRFCKHVENILDPEGRWRHGSEDQSLTTPMDECDDNEGKGEAAPSPKGKSRSPDARAQGGTESDEDAEAQKANKAKEKTRREEERLDRITRKKHLEWFRMQSQDLLFDVSDRIDELEGLRESARSTAQSVNDLLSLKQQQASVVQAWESVNQAEEAVHQGRSIMMFTIITIVFLPLSFMSSIFGMNNIDFKDDNNTWSLSGQLQLMFPISIGIMVVSLIFAFHDFVRAFIWSVYTYLATLIVVKTGLYGLWLEYGSKNLRSASLMRKAADKVARLKEDVKKQRRKKKTDELSAKRQRDAEEEVESKAEGDAGLVALAADEAVSGAPNGVAPTKPTGGPNRFPFRKGWLAGKKRLNKSKRALAGHKPGTPPVTASGARSPQSPRSPRSRGQSIAGGPPGISFADEQTKEEEEQIEEKDMHAGTSNMV